MSGAHPHPHPQGTSQALARFPADSRVVTNQFIGGGKGVGDGSLGGEACGMHPRDRAGVERAFSSILQG